MQPVSRQRGHAECALPRRMPLGVLVLVAGLLVAAPSPAPADGPARGGEVVASGDSTGLAGEAVSDEALAAVRGANVPSEGPSRPDRSVGVILWDEAGASSGRSSRHRSTGSDNRQTNRLTLETRQ